MISETDNFRDTIAATGLTPLEIIADGRWHSFSSCQKPTNKVAGTYCIPTTCRWGVLRLARGFHANMVQQSRHGHDRGGASCAPRARSSAMQRQREVVLAQRQHWQHRRTSAMDAGQPCTQHDDLTRKGIQPHGVKIEGDKLLIPMRDRTGAMAACKPSRRTLQDVYVRRQDQRLLFRHRQTPGGVDRVRRLCNRGKHPRMLRSCGRGCLQRWKPGSSRPCAAQQTRPSKSSLQPMMTTRPRQPWPDKPRQRHRRLAVFWPYLYSRSCQHDELDRLQ